MKSLVLDIKLVAGPVEVIFADKHKNMPEYMTVKEYLHSFILAQSCSLREMWYPEPESHNYTREGREQTRVNLLNMKVCAEIKPPNNRCRKEKHLSKGYHEYFIAVHWVFDALRMEEHNKVAQNQGCDDTHDQVPLPAPVSEEMIGYDNESAEHDSYDAW